MTIANDLITNSLDVRGRIGAVVIQGCAPQYANAKSSLGKPLMIREYVQVINPKTSAQVAQQNKLKAAVAAWQSASQEIREQSRQTAIKRNITLYMAFVSDFIKAYSPTEGTVWDSGTTVWDSGTTVWDL